MPASLPLSAQDLANLQNRVRWHDEEALTKTLSDAQAPSPAALQGMMEKARDLQGLTLGEVAALTAVKDPEALEQIFDAARFVKEKIYGKRIVLFAPLYFNNKCANECSYCAFRASNKELTRRTLTQDDIALETMALLKQGQKRTLLIAGEDSSPAGLKLLFDGIKTVYAVDPHKRNRIRRVNVNVAPLAVEHYKTLKELEMGTYQLFQETYRRKTYETVHVSGPKAVMNWRLDAMDRAMEAGIGDIGMGVLYGLDDWRFETLALMQHIAHLEKTYGVGCHTISVPRMEPAIGSDMASNPPHPVSDQDFKKIVALLRLAVPYTGMIMSTRESAAMRDETLQLGVSQISAGSRTDPGGYTRDDNTTTSQFECGDHRTLDVVVQSLMTGGFIPSFCTACEEQGREGSDFMPLAKAGKIGKFCTPNAIQTLGEYLEDYASPETKEIGKAFIESQLPLLPPKIRAALSERLARVNKGESYTPF